MLESKAASGKDDINRTKYIFNSERIIPTHLNTAAEQTNKALSCWKHRNFARDLCSPFPSPWKSLSFEELEIKQEPLYNISAASPLTHTWAQQNRADMCPHSTAVPRAVAGPAPSASSFILQRWHSDLLHSERSDRFPWPRRTKHWGGQSWWQFKWHSK